MKKFRRRIEDFTCENCGQTVSGDGFTNHCPHCLWSKHVDINPGDRAAECRGMMKPVQFETKHGVTRILHRCMRCDTLSPNKVHDSDHSESILKVMKELAEQIEKNGRQKRN